MKKLERPLALLLAMMLVVSVCFNSGTIAFATEISSTVAEEAVPVIEDKLNQGDLEEETLEEEAVAKDDTADEAEDKTKEGAHAESAALNMDAINEVVQLFDALPAALDVMEMNSEEINEVMQQALEAMDAFDALSYKECEYFMENYPELYDAVMVDLSDVLAGVANNGIEPMSLLPLEEVKAYLVLNDYNEEEIKAMPISKTLSLLEDKDGNPIDYPSNATSVWVHFKTDEDNIDRYDYYTIDSNETVDLSEAANVLGYKFELIVGSGNQLSTENIRYIVKVYTGYPESFEFELYSQGTDSVRTKINPVRQEFVKSNSPMISANGTNVPAWNYVYYLEAGETVINPYLGMTSQLDEHPDISVKVYETSDFLTNGWEAQEITGQVLDQNMTKINAGYRMTGTFASFCVLYYLDGIQADCIIVDFLITGGASELIGALYLKEDGKKIKVSDSVNYSLAMDAVDSYVESYQYVLDTEHSADAEYYLCLDIFSGISGENINNQIVKAVIGHYNSFDEAASQPDIKDQLFSDDGYKANYSGDGINITIFFQENNNYSTKTACFMTFKAIDSTDLIRDYNDAPIVGEQDPWFRVTGANDENGNAIDTYVVENGKAINMDTMYGYGYQTIFINDEDVDMSKIQPTFWLADSDRIEAYVDGKKVESGDTVDFSSGTVQFTVIIDDHVKNYQVTVVQKSSGSNLFVCGPTTQEVFLDEYFEYKHDILIANLGDEPLTGLTVKLDATNCKLDDYWTVGGENNDTLAAFTTTSSSTEYGELANLAKIRLLPDGDGDIEGTLTIYADGQEPVVITLTGRAQNPKVVTTSLDDAVKYVPYSYLVTTNNMYDWTDVFFTLTGDLPEGVKFYPETGEIYGVPQETGEFEIQIEATFTSDTYEFESSSVELTLTVLENTNENVYLASDANYEIKQAIGTQTGDYDFVLEAIEDTVFTSYGEFGEFVDIWLNGEKLVEGVDYTKEKGSTKITIKSQTIEQKANDDGSENTIAMEFRTETENEENEGELKRTAQNFTVKSSAEKVIETIDALPSNINLSHKSAVQAARAAYDALSETDKAKVTNYSKLTAAEATIATLEENERKDREAASKVVALIDAIPTPITLDSKDAVNAARVAYGLLTSTQKGYVANYSKLTAAEAALEQLEAAEREKDEVNEAIALINAISDPVTLNDKAAVEAARKAYDALTASQKQEVINYSKLTATENTIAALEALEKATSENRAVAQTVIDIIDNLPNSITLDDKEAVEAARSAYENLTDTQKQLVSNLDKLRKAEDTIAALEAYEPASQADKAAADKVMDMIDKLPDNITLNDKEAVEAARKAYDELTESRKQIVLNYDVLVVAEVAIAELEHEDYQDHQSVTFVGHVVDKNRNPMADVIVEIHSTVQTARTDSNGYFRFNDVEMGAHSIIVKDANGEVIATKDFSIVSGSPLALTGDIITAENKSVLTVTIQVKQDTLFFLNLQEGDHTTPGVDITSPQTGDNTNLVLWYIALAFSLFVVIVLSFYIRKKSRV